MRREPTLMQEPFLGEKQMLAFMLRGFRDCIELESVVGTMIVLKVHYQLAYEHSLFYFQVSPKTMPVYIQ